MREPSGWWRGHIGGWAVDLTQDVRQALEGLS